MCEDIEEKLEHIFYFYVAPECILRDREKDFMIAAILKVFEYDKLCRISKTLDIRELKHLVCFTSFHIGWKSDPMEIQCYWSRMFVAILKRHQRKRNDLMDISRNIVHA